ncbi:MAG: nodulation protein NfeD [Candidatus Thermoplasmatota archaeon]|nr:nodulation protein NfeD [Candidatus Thermoplasmatota archaeon]
MMRRLPLFLFLICLISLNTTFVASAADRSVLLVELTDTIDHISKDIFTDALAQAHDMDAAAVILILQTPGGGLKETFEIAESIDTSEIPVVGYVYPTGASAWSAGTFILLSTHIAAMADHSIIGSCQPVEIGFTGSRVINDSKTINALVQWLTERASIYGRNTTLAEEFIRINRNVNASVALEQGVIEFTANTLTELLSSIDGKMVKTTIGNTTLETANSWIRWFSPPLQTQIRKILSNPVLSSLLLMLGIFSLLAGISAPGYGAEVFGVVAILLSLIGSGFAVTELSILFIVIGVLLLVLELWAIPGFGVVGIGGIICLVIGSVFLIPTYPNQQWVISMAWVDTFLVVLIVTVILFAVFFLFLLYKIVEVRKKKRVVGEFVGETALTVDTLTPDMIGYVRFKGELWQASSDQIIEKNTKVLITGKDGAVLLVVPLDISPKH